MLLNKQQHLNYKNRINLGAYYTQAEYVDIVWDMIKPYLKKGSVVLDNTCGYGNFLKPYLAYKQIGNDIDSKAVSYAKSKIALDFYNHNALYKISRSQYNIDDKTPLCIIGNPPYNDRTSIIRNKIKSTDTLIDKDILTRDLGLSFLLSYNKLKADIVCVLHPLSYLIKKANFSSLKNFADNYNLVAGKIISSGVFSQSSKSTHFPIIIALYQKSQQGMKYQHILDFPFAVVGGATFSLNFFDSIANYVIKYPSKHKKPNKDDILFWTLRDINALKRNKTFIKKYSTNTIIVDKSKLDYYIYIDVFKQFLNHIPYYFGNCDVMIDDALFAKYKKYFILEALARHEYLQKYYTDYNIFSVELAKQKIIAYFKILLGEHYAC